MPTRADDRWQRWLCASLLWLAFAFTLDTAPAHATFAPAPGSPLAVGADPYTALAQDLNGDGRVDVAALNTTSSSLSVFLRTPAGAFAAASGSPFATGSGPSKVVVADFNADGRPDFAVSNYVAGTVGVLLGQPGGGWAQEAGGPLGVQWAAAVAVADINADARPDLLVPDFEAGNVSVLLRQASGGFVSAPDKPATGSNPRDLAVADFNADGRPDMAVTNSGSGTVTVLLGQAAGKFTAEGSPIPVGTQPQGIVARDLNGDGRPDLAVANHGPGNVTVLLRQGSGFVSDPASPVASGAGPVGIATADFNGDGRPDLAVANNVGNTVSVLLRRAGGGYEPDAASPIALPAGPAGVAAADVDGDGRPDLVVTSGGAKVLSILLNTTPAPSPSPPGPAAAIAQLRPPAMVGLPAKSIEVAGAGGKLSALMKEMLAKPDLEASLRSAAASSRLEVQAKEQRVGVRAGIEQRLDSFVYGIPVEIQGMVGQIVEVAGAIAIASRGGAGETRVATVELPPVVAELQAKSTVVRLPVDAKAAAELQRNGVSEAALAMIAKQVGETTGKVGGLEGKLDSLSEMGEMESLRLQMAMDRMSKTMSTLSNMLRKVGETSSTITGNLKRPGGKKPASKASLLRQAGAAAKKANAAAHEGAALLVPVIRAHRTASPRATFALKPCAKRCSYPRFGR